MNIHWQIIQGDVFAGSAAEGERIARSQVEKFVGDMVKINHLWLSASPESVSVNGTIRVWMVSFKAVVERKDINGY